MSNDFKLFSGGGGANVLTQAQYEALASLIANGFQTGIAPSNQFNKVWRQASMGSAVLGDLIAGITGQNVTDDGTTATIASNLMAAIALAGHKADSGVVNAYAITLAPAPLAYYNGMKVSFKTANTNTANAPTLNVNGLGAVTLTEPNGKLIVINQLPANTIVEAVYNSTGPRFEVTNLQRNNIGPLQAYSTTVTLTAGDLEKMVNFTGGPYTVTLPAANAVQEGDYLVLRGANSTGDVTLSRAGSDVIAAQSGISLTSLIMKNGDLLVLRSSGTNTWIPISGTNLQMIYSDTWKQMQGYAPQIDYATSATIASTDFGKAIQYTGASAGTLTLPSGSLVAGQTLNISVQNTGVCTIASGAANIYANGQSAVASIALVRGMSISLTYNGASWIQKHGFPYYASSTTPTPSPSAGAFNNIACTLNYVMVGKLCFYKVQFSSTDIGTASGYVVVPMPFTSANVASQSQVCSGVNKTTNVQISGRIVENSAALLVFKYDATFPFASNQACSLSGVYEVA